MTRLALAAIACALSLATGTSLRAQPSRPERPAVRPEEHMVLVRGAVPGARNGTVILSKPPGSARGAADQ